MRSATAFAPGHITGFFEICENPNPLLMGSRGAGISISRGVVTEVYVEEATNRRVEVFANGPFKAFNGFKVTEHVAIRLLNLALKPYRAIIKHHFEIPVGSGFGASGAGALSAALALNEALGLGLSDVEAAQVAHVAEVLHRTGLGDVSAQFIGGFEVRSKPGAPGVGVIERLPVEEDLTVLCASLGSFETREMITAPLFKERINKVGRWALNMLTTSPSIEHFIELSTVFAEEVGFMEPNLKVAVNLVRNEGGLGLSIKKKALFILAPAQIALKLLKPLTRLFPNLKFFTSKIALMGSYLIKDNR
ncbi:MAG: hypothetical protein QXK12_01285 [Candidatus Nezhaarchaeales archaeon]